MIIKCIIIFAECFFFLVNMGCNDNKNNEKQTKVGRDNTITPANAYSEIFLDSVLLEDFIAKEVKTDSIAHYMRNFYNSRNYKGRMKKLKQL